MNTTAELLSTQTPDGMQNPPATLHASAPAAHPPILAERWPSLGRALTRYEQGTAEQFSRLAYNAIVSGLIRHTDRQRLADQAESLGIRSFDAQLLIACAIRQWALDHRYDSTPSLKAPRLSYEYRAWRRAWTRVALVIGTALVLDGIILWKWLS